MPGNAGLLCVRDGCPWATWVGAGPREGTWLGGTLCKPPSQGGGVRTQEVGARLRAGGTWPGSPQTPAQHPFCREAPSEVDGDQSQVTPADPGVCG